MSHSTIFPMSTKDNYSQNDIVDWSLAFEDKAILQSSIRITGKVRVALKTALPGGGAVNAKARLDVIKDVQIDGTVGIAGAFQSVTCSTDQQGIIENQNEHPRYVKAKSVAQTTAQHLFTDTRNTPELRTGVDIHTRYLLAGNSNTDSSDVADTYIPFSWKPDIAFNKSSMNISHKKTGNLKISVRLATDQQFLYGTDASDHSYVISDLRLEYKTVPDKGASGNLTFATIHMIKSTAQSNNTNLSTRVPAIVQSVSMVFHKDAQLNTAQYNHLQLEEPPAVSRVEFSFNDSLTNYYTTALESVQEILFNYQRSWGVKGASKNNLNFNKLNSNENYGIGMPFGQYIDMSKGAKFGVNILSGINSVVKYGVFLYFRGIVQI